MMHIADGILATELVLAADAASIGAIYLFGKKIDTDDIPKMGMMAAALFVASLVHFPIAGTSMHLGLYGLAGILLGWLSFPVVFLALLFQSLLFQHGGLLSTGINAINMGAGALLAYGIWSLKGISGVVEGLYGRISRHLFCRLPDGRRISAVGIRKRLFLSPGRIRCRRRHRRSFDCFCYRISSQG